MDVKEYRRRGKEMVDYICDYLENIRERRVFPNVSPGYMRDLVPTCAPDQGEPWDSIMADVERVVMPGMTHWQSPHMHAYFPALNCYPSLLGDMLSNAINCLGFTWASSPACTELETIVMDWLGKMIGLPQSFLHKDNQTSGGGVIQTTCSEATLVSLLAARKDAIQKLQEDGSAAECVDDSVLNARLVAYCSDQAHSSVEKASLIGLVKLRLLPSDDDLSLRGCALMEAIVEDRANGLTPFYLCATLGTTGACAFDNLQELGKICEEEGLWMHVDAAYAGTAFLCPEYRHFLAGIHYAESFAFNPSKWMMVNFDCTAMWVKSSGHLHRAFNVEPLYLKHENSGAAIDYMHWQIPLSKRFRSLKLWFVMRSYGIEGLQSHVRHGVQNGEYFESLVRADPRFEIPAKRHLGLVVFRLKGANKLTEQLLKVLNRDGRVHMVPASLKGTYVIRFTVTSQRTDREDLTRDWMIIQAAADGIMSEARASAAASTRQSKHQFTRRSTFTYGDLDLSLVLSNVPSTLKFINGSFAALLDRGVHLDITHASAQKEKAKKNMLKSCYSLDSGEAAYKNGDGKLTFLHPLSSIASVADVAAEERSTDDESDEDGALADSVASETGKQQQRETTVDAV